MKLKLSDWAGFAEIFSGIAVVITLVLLILGIRENTAITRVAVCDRLIAEIGSVNRDALLNAEVDRIVSALFSRNIEDLDERDRSRLGNYVLYLFRVYERAYFSEQYGILGDAEWERFSRQICLQLDNAAAVGVEMMSHAALTEEFRGYMAVTCQGEGHL